MIGRFSVEEVVKLRQLNLQNTLLWKTYYLKWCDVYDLVEGLGLPFGLTYQKACLLLKGNWIFLGCIVFPVLLLSVEFFTFWYGWLLWQLVCCLDLLLWHETCWHRNGHSIHCQCTFYWLHDCYVLLLYFLDTCRIDQCMIDCTFLQDRTICRLEASWFSLEQNSCCSCRQAFIYFSRLHQVRKGTGKTALIWSLTGLLSMLRVCWEVWKVRTLGEEEMGKWNK